jgi:FkbM family methyltransferase
MTVRIRRPFSRRQKLKELLLSQMLRRQPVDFAKSRPMVSIIGDHISDRIRASGLYEREILEFLRDHVFDRALCGEQTALDVGANIGNHSIFFSDLFKKVVAFEPNPLARTILEVNAELNGVANIDLRATALSDKSGSSVLHFAPGNLGAAHLATAGAQSMERKVKVELAVGDEVVASEEPIGFIKVDVEGAELQVLQGLEQTIRSHLPLIMLEQWPAVIDGPTGTSPAVGFLSGLGYSMWQLNSGALDEGAFAKLASLIRGRADEAMAPLARLDKRQYPALLFTPRDYRFPAN